MTVHIPPDQATAFAPQDDGTTMPSSHLVTVRIFTDNGEPDYNTEETIPASRFREEYPHLGYIAHVVEHPDFNNIRISVDVHRLIITRC